MGGLGGLLQTAGVLVGLLSAAGFGWQRGRVADLRTQVSDANTRIDFLVSERADDKALIAEQATTIANLTSDFAVLQRTVTGQVHWQVISDQMADQGKLLVEQSKLIIELRDEVRRHSE